MPLNNIQPTNLPVTYDTPQVNDTVGAPVDQITKPSSSLSLENTLYGALVEGPSATLGTYLDTNFVQPYLTDTDRPYLTQDKVNKLWSDNGIPDKAPDANKYNDVGIYYLLDRAQRRQDMREVDAQTPYGYIGTPVRFAAGLVAGMADPINIAASFFPTAKLADMIGANSVAAGIRSLEATASTGATLGQRVGARFATGALEGAVGNLPVEAATAPLRSQMGEDYSATDSLMNLAMGSAIGGGIHVVTGGLSRGHVLDENVNDNAEPVNNNTVNETNTTETPSEINQFNPQNANQDKENINDSFLNTNTGETPSNSDFDQVDTLYNNMQQIGSPVQKEPENIGDYSLRNNLSEAIDKNKDSENLANPLDETSQTLSDFIAKPTTTPRMLADVINKYHDEVKSLTKTDKLTTNKNSILTDVINSTQPMAKELANIATPETREIVLKAAVGQIMDEKYPTVDSLLRADSNIGEKNLFDIQKDFEQASNPENSYLTSDVPELNDYEKNISISKDIGEQEEKVNINNQITKIENLSDKSLYSVASPTDEVNKSIMNIDYLQQEIYNQFGDDGKKLLDTGKINLVNEVSDLPGEHNNKNIQGMVNSDGRVFLVAKNLDPARLKGVVLHEVGVHANMKEYVGEKTFKNILNEMDRILKEDDNLNNIVNEAIPENTPLEHIQEEKLAYVIENLPDAPLVQQMISKVRAYLYKTFPSIQKFMNLTDQDLLQMAALSLRNYAKEDITISPSEIKYSQVDDDIETVQDRLDGINKSMEKADQLKKDLAGLDDSFFANINDKSSIQELQNSIRYMNDKDIKELYSDLTRAYNRYYESGKSNAAELATNYVVNKLENGLLKSKLANTHDKAIIKKVNNYLKASWTGFEKNGLDSLLVSTVLQRYGARAYNLGAEMVNNKRLILGNFLKQLDASGTRKAFIKNIFADDTMRAMELLQNNQSIDHLPVEAIQFAKMIQNLYDHQVSEMRENGLITNKVKNYFFDQSNSHAQEKIYAAGFENWLSTARKTFDFEAMADSMNISVSQIDDKLLRGIYDGLSTGEHIGNRGNLGATFNASSFYSSVKNKQRIIHFKNADSAIEYRNLYGNRDFSSSVIGTLENNAKKIALLKVLGVNYEKNLHQIANELKSNVINIDSKRKLSSYIRGNMQKQLESVDGRADIPCNKLAARISSNVRAIKSMASLGMASVSAVTDVINSAAFLNRKGLGRGIVVDSIKQLVGTFSKYSDERKQFLSSMGTYADSVFSNAYRDGNGDQSVGKWLAKKQSLFFEMTGLDAWTNSTRLSSMDALMHYMGETATKKDFDSLSLSMQKQLGLFNIDKDTWNLIRQSNLKQIDGRNYLSPEEFDGLRSQIENKFAGQNLTADELKMVTDKYISNTKRNMFNFYMDGLSHMIIEPDAVTKYYQTFQGLKPGSLGGEIARFIMQFKSFSVGFLRKVLLDQFYESNDSILFGTRKEGGKWYQRDFSNNYINDFSREGVGQKINLIKYIAGLTVGGYVASAIKDVLKGKQPRPIYDEDAVGGINKSTLLSSFLQGGALGIYGDYLFGDFNRFGGSLSGTLAGPVIGGTGDQLASLWSNLRQGNDVKASAARTLIQNTPFVNMFYTSAAFNYAFAYSLQEYLNPGSLRRMERKMQDQNNQQFIFKPSEYAPRW